MNAMVGYRPNKGNSGPYNTSFDKIISCIFGKFEKTTEVMYMPDGSVATNTYRSQTSFNDNVPIGITFEEGKEIDLISLKDSSTYFQYNTYIHT